jgi:hypothetical protein
VSSCWHVASIWRQTLWHVFASTANQKGHKDELGCPSYLPFHPAHHDCVGWGSGVAVAKGMMSCCPMLSRVLVRPLASMIAWTVVPYVAAMS